MSVIVTRRISSISNASLDAWLSTKNEQELAGIPLDATFTYNPDGTVATKLQNGVTTTFTYAAGKLSQTNDGTYQKDFNYTGDNLTSIDVTIL